MKKIFFYLAAVLAVFTIQGCSSDDGDDAGGSEAKKYLAEIVVKEHEWKFGEKSTSGEDYERFIYDTNGRLTRKETNYYNAIVGRIPHQYTYIYDDKGHLIEKNDYMMSVLQDKYKYTYNSIDSVALMQDYNKDGKLSEEWEYSYDSQSRLIQAKETNGISTLRYVDDYTYSGNNVTVTRHRIDNGKLFGTTLYEYDSHHNLVKKTWTNGDTGKKDIEVLNEYEYNSKGQISKLTKHEYYNKDDLSYRDYTYNEDGTIKSIHLSYSWKNDQSDLDYTYTWK